MDMDIIQKMTVRNHYCHFYLKENSEISIFKRQKIKMSKYKDNIKKRSIFQFAKGLLPRFYCYLKNNYITWLARHNGAIIGKSVTMPYRLAKISNKNLVIGDNTSIQTHLIDLRSKVLIGRNVIIGSGVEIITVSHNVDSADFEAKYYGIIIDDFVWLATKSVILPSCREIGYGSVCGAFSVVAKDVLPYNIVVGNPAVFLRDRKNIHSLHCVESLLGNDFISYIKAYFEI